MSGKRTRATGIPGLVAALAAVVFVVAGCAPRGTDGDEPTADADRQSAREWTCEPTEAASAERLAGRTELWAHEGGSMFSAHRTREREDAPPGRATRDEAIADAISSATDAALDLLEHRGVSYDAARRVEIVEEATRAAVRGGDVAFPRMDVIVRSWEECVAGSQGTEAGADTTWRASVLVEYPIGLLRGDVRNALWDRERAANEAEVLIASAEEHLAAGRWHAGLLDAASAARVVRATGARLEATEPPPLPPDQVVDGAAVTQTATSRLLDDRLWLVLERSRSAAQRALPVLASAVGGVDVVESGASSGTTVEFRCAYEWNGRTVAATGVPVRFEMPGASAVLDAEPATDASGTATCRIIEAHGAPGEYELAVYLDAEAARAALEGTAAGTAWLEDQAPMGRRSVHLVTGAHAISVCARLGEGTDADVAQAAAGFARRMERDGFRMGDCGPDVDVVVTGEVSLNTTGGPGSWTVEAVLTGTAFDQRTARGLGETSVRATQVSSAEGGADARRDAEVLALKEAGRLLAVYFQPKILSSVK